MTGGRSFWRAVVGYGNDVYSLGIHVSALAEVANVELLQAVNVANPSISYSLRARLDFLSLPSEVLLG